MDLQIRQLTDADMKQAMRLGSESFGNPPTPDEDLPSSTREGREWFGAFDGDLLVAQAINREFHSWFGGVAIPTAGVAFVGVTAEYRGRGIVRPLLEAVLASAVDRGSVVSALFPTAPRVYRGLGYERITDLIFATIPTSALSGLPQSSTTTRRATVDDLAAIREIYDAWSSEQNGPLTRTSPSMGGIVDADGLAAYSGITLAVDSNGTVTGYAAWNRGEGYEADAKIEVADLIARNADAYAALLNMLGTFAGVAPTTSIRTSGDDPVRLLLPTSHWQITASTPYMLSILQVDKALSLRSYPRAITAELPFSVDGDRYSLSLDAGTGECQPTTHKDTRELTPQGLAALYAGAQSCANLRSTSQLTGGEIADDETWDAAFGGRQVHIRDYF
ncbi:putative acetyltransferase [Aeromicrobium panaciterrae]|uniref:Acetyltransferase n=1 Tax=Aeromicrobium panaciterrae TaxID=363861 RepID=A0ABU1UQQ6_9ACTN|nr:GNAT family N-acetyltransferase [Aeromicrobium panaciterrae]MDR7087503.1 putative acetyltransferase [Aeromicrobium panaciterrae]